MCDTNGGRLKYVRMPQQGLVDLPWRCIFTTFDGQLLEPARNEEIAIVIAVTAL